MIDVKSVYKKRILCITTILSFIASIFFGYCFIFFKNSKITDFSNRILSAASSKNVDISAVIKNYYIFLIFSVIFTISFCLLFQKRISVLLKNIIACIKKIIEVFVNKYILLCGCISLSAAITVYNLSVHFGFRVLFSALISLIFFLVAFFVTKILVTKLFKNHFSNILDLVSAIAVVELFSVFYSFYLQNFKLTLLSIVFFNFIIFAVYFLNKKCINEWKLSIFTFWLGSFLCEHISLSVFFSLFCAYGMFISLPLVILGNGIILIYKGDFFSSNIDLVKKITFCLSILCISLALFIEVLYTLHSYDISNFYAIVVMVLLVLFPLILSILFVKSNISLNEGKLYFLIITAIITFAYIRNYSYEFALSLFEDANHGLSFSEFHLFDEYPMIDSFDAHMLSRFILMQIYQLINSKYIVALSVPYSYIVNILIFLSLYYIFKEFIGSRNAFLVTLILPFSNLLDISNFINYYWLGFLLIAFYLFWLKKINNKNTLIANFVFWIIAAFSVVYMLDVGATFGISMVVCAIIYFIKHKRYKELRKFILSGIFTAVILLSVFILIFVVNQVDFKTWLTNFFNSVSSNQNWALGKIYNDKKHIIHCIFTYLILPIITIAAVLIANKNKIIENKLSVLFILLFAFFLNASRIITRHNLMEASNALFIFEFIVLLIVLISAIKKKLDINRNGNYKITLITLILLLPLLFYYPYIGLTNSVTDRLNINLKEVSSSINTVLTSNKKQQLNKEQKEKVDNLRHFFDLTLDNNESYIDFTNNSELYALLGLNNPVYVNQSPGLVNGEKGQIQFLNELKRKKLPFTLMPLEDIYSAYSLDHILNSDRYYLITEYICNNYVPLCKVDSYAIWCLKNDYSHYINLIGNQYELLMDYFYNDSDYYIHNLGSIPYLWSNYDSDVSTVSNKVKLSKSINNKYIIDYSLINQSQGNYLIFDITSKSDTDIDLTLSNDEYKGKEVCYNFSLLGGRHTYKIRVSSDITWCSKLLDIMTIKENEYFSVNSIYVCNGDVVNS